MVEASQYVNFSWSVSGSERRLCNFDRSQFKEDEDREERMTTRCRLGNLLLKNTSTGNIKAFFFDTEEDGLQYLFLQAVPTTALSSVNIHVVKHYCSLLRQ